MIYRIYTLWSFRIISKECHTFSMSHCRYDIMVNESKMTILKNIWPLLLTSIASYCILEHLDIMYIFYIIANETSSMISICLTQILKQHSVHIFLHVLFMATELYNGNTVKTIKDINSFILHFRLSLFHVKFLTCFIVL